MEVRDALVAWGERALGTRPQMRRVASDHLHVTLCFLDWQPVDAVGEVAEACQNIAAHAPAGSLAVDEATWLPPRRPRVLAVRLCEEDGRVVRLQSQLSERLQAGGWYLPERRQYLPHVTVARARGRAPMRPVDLPDPPRLSFVASRVTLFRSRLGPSGARYEGLASVELG